MWKPEGMRSLEYVGINWDYNIKIDVKRYRMADRRINVFVSG